MGHTTALRREIKDRFIPLILEKGFTLDTREGSTFLCFRRITPDEVQVFDLQWEKYGYPRFRLNFGTGSPAGETVADKHIAAHDLYSWTTPVMGTLKPGRGGSSAAWFRQDKPFLQKLFTKEKLYPVGKPVDDLIRLFPEVEAFWASGRTGAHVTIWRTALR